MQFSQRVDSRDAVSNDDIVWEEPVEAEHGSDDSESEYRGRGPLSGRIQCPDMTHLRSQALLFLL